MFPQCFYMLTNSGLQREMSYPGRMIILSCIYFTSIVLQIETDAWSAQTSRVKEGVFNMSCFDWFNETETQRSATMKQKEVFRSFLLLFDNAFLCIERNCLAVARSQISQIILRVFKPFH